MPKKIKRDFIVKFQRPIVTNGSYQDIMLYNEDRSLDTIMELANDEIEYLFPNKEFKTYWKCHINNKTKMLEPLEQMEEQGW